LNDSTVGKPKKNYTYYYHGTIDTRNWPIDLAGANFCDRDIVCGIVDNHFKDEDS